MEMTTIDVGQGDSILLVKPEGRTLLIDAGGLPQWMHSDFDLGEQVVSSYLWNRGIDHLDVVVITHPLCRPPRRNARGDRKFPSPRTLAEYRQAGGRVGNDRRASPERGNESLSKIKKATNSITAARISTCSLPDATKPPDRCGQTTIAWCLPPLLPRRLLCSREMPNVRAELRVVEQHLEAMLLKVAHHGSASGTSSDLLATVHPRYAVISVGARSVCGHPRREVLARLHQAEVTTYRTDEEGAVSFYLDGKSVTPDVALIH